MKLKECRELGNHLGLYTDSECLANVELHCLNLFAYSEMTQELAELKNDCIAQGVDYDGLLKQASDDFRKKIEGAKK